MRPKLIRQHACRSQSLAPSTSPASNPLLLSDPGEKERRVSQRLLGEGDGHLGERERPGSESGLGVTERLAGETKSGRGQGEPGRYAAGDTS